MWTYGDRWLIPSPTLLFFLFVCSGVEQRQRGPASFIPLLHGLQLIIKQHGVDKENLFERHERKSNAGGDQGGILTLSTDDVTNYPSRSRHTVPFVSLATPDWVSEVVTLFYIGVRGKLIFGTAQ